MTLPIAPKITQAGLAAAINANGLGTSLQLTHIALGTGAYNPSGTETALQAEVLRMPIAGGARPTPTKIQVAAIFQAATGQSFVAREIGFFAGSTLFAVASVAASPGPVLNFAVPDSYQLGMQYALELNGVPPGSVNITVDPLQSVALAVLLSHNADTGAHSDIRALVATEAANRANNINAEATARNNADTSEANSRINGDANLQNQLTALSVLPWAEFLNGTQLIGAGNQLLQGLNSTNGPSGAMLSGSSITLPSTGKWRFSGTLIHTGNDGAVQADLFLNGASIRNLVIGDYPGRFYTNGLGFTIDGSRYNSSFEIAVNLAANSVITFVSVSGGLFQVLRLNVERVR